MGTQKAADIRRRLVMLRVFWHVRGHSSLIMQPLGSKVKTYHQLRHIVMRSGRPVKGTLRQIRRN